MDSSTLVLLVAGLGLLIAGAEALVKGVSRLAAKIGVSPLIIGPTIVAFGTSAPELAVSVHSAIIGQADIAVGNAVGSNIFNSLSVLGLSSVVAPSGLRVPPTVAGFDAPVMIAVAIACLPNFFTGWEIRCWEGALFLSYYTAYTIYLVLGAIGNAALPAFSEAMGLFVLPLTAFVLAISLLRDLHARHKAARLTSNMT